MFIKNRNGYVDLSQVARAEVVQTGGPRLHGHGVPGTATKLFDAAGHDLGVAGAIDLEWLTSPVISAGPVATVICITPTGEVTAAPIAGWRVLRTGLEPLHVIEPPVGATRFLAVGGQGLVEIESGRLFPDLAAACSAVTGVVQQAHPAPAPQVAAGGRRHGTR